MVSRKCKPPGEYVQVVLDRLITYVTEIKEFNSKLEPPEETFRKQEEAVEKENKELLTKYYDATDADDARRAKMGLLENSRERRRIIHQHNSTLPARRLAYQERRTESHGRLLEAMRISAILLKRLELRAVLDDQDATEAWNNAYPRRPPIPEAGRITEATNGSSDSSGAQEVDGQRSQEVLQPIAPDGGPSTVEGPEGGNSSTQNDGNADVSTIPPPGPATPPQPSLPVDSENAPPTSRQETTPPTAAVGTDGATNSHRQPPRSRIAGPMPIFIQPDIDEQIRCLGPSNNRRIDLTADNSNENDDIIPGKFVIHPEWDTQWKHPQTKRWSGGGPSDTDRNPMYVSPMRRNHSGAVLNIPGPLSEKYVLSAAGGSFINTITPPESPNDQFRLIAPAPERQKSPPPPRRLPAAANTPRLPDYALILGRPPWKRKRGGPSKATQKGKGRAVQEPAPQETSGNATPAQEGNSASGAQDGAASTQETMGRPAAEVPYASTSAAAAAIAAIITPPSVRAYAYTTGRATSARRVPPLGAPLPDPTAPRGQKRRAQDQLPSQGPPRPGPGVGRSLPSLRNQYSRPAHDEPPATNSGNDSDAVVTHTILRSDYGLQAGRRETPIAIETDVLPPIRPRHSQEAHPTLPGTRDVLTGMPPPGGGLQGRRFPILRYGGIPKELEEWP